MLTSRRSLQLHKSSGAPLPVIPAFKALYEAGTTPRHGEVIMIAGRSGTQKSGLALFWVDQMNLPTLYLSADMNGFTASSRVACTRLGLTLEELEKTLKAGGPGVQDVDQALGESNIVFTFDSPITWRGLDRALEAWVESRDEWPQVIVIDNLMDVEGATSDYTMQMEVMTEATSLARETGATVMILHHASDKSWEAKSDPWKPPARSEIKNGLGEKPELCLTVSLDPATGDYRIATVKQRNGPSDMSGQRYITLTCDAARTRFYEWVSPHLRVRA